VVVRREACSSMPASRKIHHVKVMARGHYAT
jgi:hypothetical protein